MLVDFNLCCAFYYSILVGIETIYVDGTSVGLSALLSEFLMVADRVKAEGICECVPMYVFECGRMTKFVLDSSR